MSCWKKHTLVFFLFGEFLAAVQFNCFLFMGFWTKHIVVLLWFRCGIYCSSPFQLFCFHGLLYKKRIVFFCLSVEFLAQSISIVLFSWIVVHKRDCLLLFRRGISCTAHSVSIVLFSWAVEKELAISTFLFSWIAANTCIGLLLFKREISCRSSFHSHGLLTKNLRLIALVLFGCVISYISPFPLFVFMGCWKNVRWFSFV